MWTAVDRNGEEHEGGTGDLDAFETERIKDVFSTGMHTRGYDSDDDDTVSTPTQTISAIRLSTHSPAQRP